MRLIIRSSRGEVRVDWANYALLRDNIQHFIESGRPSQRFPAIHSLERAVDRGLTKVDAARLRGELLGACYALRRVHLEDCAVSLRTRALVSKNATLPCVRGTTPARAVGWSLPSDQQTGGLIRQLKPFISSLLAVTSTAVDGDELTVKVEGPRPCRPTRPARWQAKAKAKGERGKPLSLSTESQRASESASTSLSQPVRS